MTAVLQSSGLHLLVEARLHPSLPQTPVQPQVRSPDCLRPRPRSLRFRSLSLLFSSAVTYALLPVSVLVRHRYQLQDYLPRALLFRAALLLPPALLGPPDFFDERLAVFVLEAAFLPAVFFAALFFAPPATFF